MFLAAVGLYCCVRDFFSCDEQGLLFVAVHGCGFLIVVDCLVVEASLMAQMVKNLLAMQETQVQSLCREDPLEEGMATHSSTLAWRIPWTEELGRIQPVGLPRL